MVTWPHQVELGPEPLPLAAFAAERGISACRADPLIAIRRDAWERLLAHVRPSADEAGGVLVGSVWRDPTSGQTLVDVVAALPALGAHGSPTYFRFTPAAWDAISRERDALHPDLPTVGWYHSHPGLGVFYSGTDRAAQRAFFGRPWNVGIVVDPMDGAYGLFLGPDSASLPRSHLVVYEPAPTMTPASPLPEFDRRTSLDRHPDAGMLRHPDASLNRHPDAGRISAHRTARVGWARSFACGRRMTGEGGRRMTGEGGLKMTMGAGRVAEPVAPDPPPADMPSLTVDETGPPAPWRRAAWAIFGLLALVAMLAAVVRQWARREARR
ncbi:MAG TPA: Mov34/MPN/PAD-1 family protein [Thermomicrobiales bacterium]|nr:Mov34/MPN/PAD-1 family protein [Thermomicrobiales bacterium]